MDESQFWVAVWKIVAIAVVIVILSVGGCTAHQNSLIADAIKGGVNPIEASCAFGGKEGVVCAVRAVKP